MKTYYFDVSGDAPMTREVLEALDDEAAMRQAVLLLSEIVRDHALSTRGDLDLRIVVRDAAGEPIWSGSASGQT